MTTDLTLYVFVYDIGSDLRRGKVYALLRQYGVPVQKSAFEARLTRAEAGRVIDGVRRLLGMGIGSSRTRSRQPMSG